MLLLVSGHRGAAQQPAIDSFLVVMLFDFLFWLASGFGAVRRSRGISVYKWSSSSISSCVGSIRFHGLAVVHNIFQHKHTSLLGVGVAQLP